MSWKKLFCPQLRARASDRFRIYPKTAGSQSTHLTVVEFDGPAFDQKLLRGVHTRTVSTKGEFPLSFF